MRGNRESHPALIASALALFGVWLVANFHRLTAQEEGFIRFVLGIFFSILIVLRWKPAEVKPLFTLRAALGTGLVGAVLAVGGLIFRIHQFEWLGLILILFACLRWGLPERYCRDVVVALFILYWVHPLPGQVFGKFQLAMQTLSVKGAEWLLQALNVHVWADGTVIRMGVRAFGIPEACSGMRTSVTVLVCALGVGVLLRLRWYEIPLFMLLGTVQVLLLNILRITGMVLWAPRMPPGWGENFLHDTMGIFLLVSILVVLTEIAWCRAVRDRRTRRREALRLGEREEPDRATILPEFWRHVARWWMRVTVGIAAIGVISFLGYQRRPSHRGAMIRGVIDSLVEYDTAAAERAISAALKLAPGDRGLLSYRVRALVFGGKHAEALAQLEALGTDLTPIEIVMKSWCLMALNRPKEAIAALDAIPASLQNTPGVAIVRAEYAASQDDPEGVVKNIVIAARRYTLARRVRALFPYLAACEQWKAIADCNMPVPFDDLKTALLAIHANLHVGNIAGTAGIIQRALEKWPNEPDLLNGLYQVALARPGSQWEKLAADLLVATLDKLSTDQLATSIESCFRLHRPDLAWLAYRRLEELDATHPHIYLAAAQHAHDWFVCRSQAAGVKSEASTGVVDLRSFYHQTLLLSPLASMWRRVPLAEEMATGNPDQVRGKYLTLCVQELWKREKDGRLTKGMHLLYPDVLSMLGRYDEAHAQLDEIEKRYPALRGHVLQNHGLLYAKQGRWEDAYETLTKYYGEYSTTSVAAELAMVAAMLRLGMGAAALQRAEQALASFPGSPEVKTALAGIWDFYGFREEALFFLTEPEIPGAERAIVQLLYDTGRVREAERLARIYGVSIERQPGVSTQVHMLPPAEIVLQKRWPEPLTEEQMDEESRIRNRIAERTTSPFIRQLRTLDAAWLRARGTGGVADIEKWVECGRNNAEKVTALHRLAMLHARQRQYEPAASAVKRALEFMPNSAILWRMLIALTDGDGEVIVRAREACPRDPDCWLAWLVHKTHAEGMGQWATEAIRVAGTEKTFPVATMVRAGQFLFNQKMYDAAAIAAREAEIRGRGFLPAHVLAMRCAVAKGDVKWALAAALRGVDAALDPAPFYKVIVDLKSFRGETDADVVAALEHLRAQFPESTEWSERLGFVYFHKGDPKRALSVLAPVLQQHAKTMRVDSLLLAAESARLEERLKDAIALLETAYALYPDNLRVLNNLVYTLAQNRETLGRARQLLDRLLEMGRDSFEVLDTAAFVYLRSGEMDRARVYMQQALDRLKRGTYSEAEILVNSAEVFYRSGQYKEALGKLEELRRVSQRTDVVELRARELRRAVEEALRGI
ncbi:MAG: archaeosortase/exosortase family protein [Kiritimatiellae bacterium]|nr:archaeosortase/exosortase family protein [Kiritimatiellia bacterium]